LEPSPIAAASLLATWVAPRIALTFTLQEYRVQGLRRWRRNNYFAI
jgi:hypothetical protein